MIFLKQTHTYYLYTHHECIPIYMHTYYPHKCMCTHSQTHAHTCTLPWPHMCIQLSTHILPHFLFAWASQPPCTPVPHTRTHHTTITTLIPANGLATRKTWGLIWETEFGAPRGAVSQAILLLFIFLNVLSEPYCQMFSPYNDNVAHSSFFQRNRDVSGPYSVLLEPIVSAF